MYIKRKIEKDISLSLKNSKISIVLGARQVGKTTLLKKYVEEIGGVILNLDIGVDRAKFDLASKLSPVEALKYLNADKILVIDEAQKDFEVGRLVKGWYDFGVKTKIVLSGSSSLDLMNIFAESLTGRNEKFFLTPFCFDEAILSQEWFNSSISNGLLKSNLGDQLNSFLTKYLLYGGYPEAVLSDNPEKYLRNLVDDYLLKDVLSEGLIRSVDTIKKLLLMLAYQVGNEVSVSELSRNLQISRQTVVKYIEILEKIYLIFKLPSYSTNPRKEINKSSKIYFWDVGIRNALINEFTSPDFRPDMGAVWENFIIAEFAKRNIINNNIDNLYFWRTKSGSEVDLVIKTKNGLLAYEMKWGKARKVVGTAFTNKFSVPVMVINRENVFDLFLV